MKRIIIVDDDLAIQEAFRLIFDPKEYLVEVYSDAGPILSNKIRIPDLFILDKQLSGVDGLEICRFLKEHEQTKNIPVMFLSASPNIKQMALKAGADNALEKPFRTQVLREMVKSLLNCLD
jgi:DNA-binding response OmpR family regulator